MELLPVRRISDPGVQIHGLLERLGVAQFLELPSLLRKLLGLLGERSLKLVPPFPKLGGQVVRVELSAIEGLRLLGLRRYLSLGLDFGLRGCVSCTLGSGRSGLLVRRELVTSRVSECLCYLVVGPLTVAGYVVPSATQFLGSV